MRFSVGAGGGTRTRMPSRAAHFECAASAISPPRQGSPKSVAHPVRRRGGSGGGNHLAGSPRRRRLEARHRSGAHQGNRPASGPTTRPCTRPSRGSEARYGSASTASCPGARWFWPRTSTTPSRISTLSGSIGATPDGRPGNNTGRTRRFALLGRTRRTRNAPLPKIGSGTWAEDLRSIAGG